MDDNFEMPASEGTSTPPEKKKNTTLIIVVVVLLVLCCCCALIAGGGYWLWVNGDALLEQFEFSVLPTLRVFS